jgi:hypothetical protein
MRSATINYFAIASRILPILFLSGISSCVVAEMEEDDDSLFGNTASNIVGGIEGSASIQGVTIINNRVWIDGKEIQPHINRVISKSGQIYLIKRNLSGVLVTSEAKRSGK